MEDGLHEGASVRVVMQRIRRARLMLSEEKDEWAEVDRGLVYLVCFVRTTAGTPPLDLRRAAKSLLMAKIDTNAEGRPASVLDMGGDVLVVPQASLSGKLKGNTPQYHAQVAKEKGLELYTAFITILNEEAVAAGKVITIKAGVYGNRQALSTESDGPYTHMFEF